MTSLCPCCRQPLPMTTRLVVDLDSNHAVARGRFVHLQPEQAALAHALLRAWPHTLRHERIMSALWGNSPVDDATRTMRTQISRLRKALLPLRYSVVSVWGEGYRLIDQAVDIPKIPARMGLSQNPGTGA